jgi:hypothetical protein
VITSWDQNDHIFNVEFNVELIGRPFGQERRAAQLNAFCPNYRTRQVGLCARGHLGWR